jgi:hypothetical protein
MIRLHDHPLPPPLPSVSGTSDTRKTEKKSQLADGREVRKGEGGRGAEKAWPSINDSILSGVELTRFLQKEEMPAFLISPPSWKRRKVNTLRQITSLSFLLRIFQLEVQNLNK